MGHFTAQATADAAVQYLGYRIHAQRIGIRLDRQRRAARQANARMVAGTGILIDTEAVTHHAFAFLDLAAENRLFAALPVQHALGLGDDDLGSGLVRCHRFAQGVAHFRHFIGVGLKLDPFGAHAAHRLFDRLFGVAYPIHAWCIRGQEILATGRRSIVVIDDDEDIIVLVEYRIADTAGQTVVPETTVTDNADAALFRATVAER